MENLDISNSSTKEYYRKLYRHHRIAVKKLAEENVSINDYISLLYELANLYEHGLGTRQNYKKAFHYYKLAADWYIPYEDRQFCGLILIKSMIKVGQFYKEGYGVKKNTSNAIDYFLFADNLGGRRASYLLGLLEEFGSGIDNSVKKALDYYHSAVYNDVFEAQIAYARTIIKHELFLSDDFKTKFKEAYDIAKFLDYIEKTLGIELVLCPSGKFYMGCLDEDRKYSDVKERHQDIIRFYFFIGKYQVTQSLYNLIMHNNPSHFIGNRNPVESITWDEAKLFCEKLNIITERMRPSSYRFDLPTEAQWEYACRAGTSTSFNNGKNIEHYLDGCSSFSRFDSILDIAQVECANTKSVGVKRPNAWGIYDMHGNVWEYCLDIFNSTNEKPLMGDGKFHVCKGGSWNSKIEQCMSCSRAAFMFESDEIGFRIVLKKEEL